MLSNLFKNDKAMAWVLVILAVISLFVPLCNLLFAPDSPLYFSAYTVSILGKYMTFALLGMSLDLVWGYCGILALGHGAFFALGGYVMGMYLMRQIGSRGVYGDPLLPDFMVFLD
jgi:urea transport system permease protein